MKRISIGSWAYTIGPYQDRPVEWDTVCDRLRELGFDGVELGSFAPHPNPNSHGDQAKRIRTEVEERGLAFSGMAADLWSEHLADTDDAGPYLRTFERSCAFARELGIAGIRVDTVQPPTLLEREDYGVVMKRVTSAYKEAARIADDHGLYLTWEFEPGFVFNKTSDIERVLDAVDAPNFGVLYDTSHGHMVAVVGARHHGEQEVLEGGQVELVKRLSGRINHVHLIDSDNTCHKDEAGEDETSMHLPFGQGVVDFDPILDELAKEELGHDWWTVDLCFWPDAWEATEICKTWMDGINQRYFGAAS